MVETLKIKHEKTCEICKYIKFTFTPGHNNVARHTLCEYIAVILRWGYEFFAKTLLCWAHKNGLR